MSTSAGGAPGGGAPAPTAIVFGTDGWRAKIGDDFTLKPLSVHGLWLAVITTPAAAPRSTTS